jgi:hypothetical protein
MGNALDRAWTLLDGLVDRIREESDDEEVSYLRAEALGAARVIALWYGDRGTSWVRSEASARRRLRERLEEEE